MYYRVIFPSFLQFFKHCFHMKTKVLTDFQICVSVPFMLLRARAEYLGGGSGFPVGWRAMGGVWFLVSGGLLLVLAK